MNYENIHRNDFQRSAPRKTWLMIVLGVTLLTALLLTSRTAGQETESTAQPPESKTAGDLVAEGVDAQGRLRLMVNKSAVVKTRVPYKQISLSQPDIAIDNEIGPTSILVTGKKAGNTQLIIWDDAGRSQMVEIVVESDLAALKDQMKTIFPTAKIEVSSSNGAIILQGRVHNLQIAEQAARIAEPYAENILNFLEIGGGQQVLLQVQFAEVSRTATSALGVNFGYTDGTSSGGSNIGQIAPFSAEAGSSGSISTPGGSPAVTLFGGGQVGSTMFRFFLSALRQNNLLRVLAEPNLIAISGQEASFLAGGEFPIPVPQSGGAGGGASTITIVYKEFGVKLKFVPVVLGDGRIRMNVQPEVSDLDFSNSVSVGGFLVPGLRTRRLATTIEMAEGQTFAIAGLLDSNVFTSKQVTPLLGDIPILGVLFRSVRYERRETELVVIVTPHLVEAMNPDQVPNLPGENWRYPNESDLFIHRDLGGPALDEDLVPAPKDAAKTGPPPRFHGRYGFAPYAPPADAGSQQ